MRKKYGSQMELPQNPDFEEIRQGIAMMEEQIESINKDVGLDMSTLRTAIKGNELGFYRIGWYAEGLPWSEEEPMSDLISRSALKDKAMSMYEAGKVWGIAPLAHEAVLVADIDCAPAVDAVPVVRCRECRHCAVCGDGLHVCKAYDGHLLRTTPDGFCHRGAKTDGGGADGA